MLEPLLRQWDGENLLVRFDQITGAWILIAIHSTRLGPGVGGTRMKHYIDLKAALEDVLKLAAGMTYKFAVPNIARGGAKAVIATPRHLDAPARADLLRRFGVLVHQLGGLFYTGPDLGTSPSDMDIIAETGAPYVFCRTPAAGGAGDPGPYTSLGVFAGIQVACEYVFGHSSVEGRRVLVQGVGDVGGNLIKYLLDNGAEVVFSETEPGRIRRFRDELGLEFVPPSGVYTSKCDIFAPCALGGILNTNTIPQLRCRAVAGGANNQLSEPSDAEILRARGTLYAPDYVINVGGAMAVIGLETSGWTRQQAHKEVSASVQRALRQIFESANNDDITTEAAARRIAEANLAAAKPPVPPTRP